MATWAIVRHWDESPIHVNAYTTASTFKTAINNFKQKWQIKVPGIPSPRELYSKIEVSEWDVVEIQPKVKKEPPKKDEQLDLNIESVGEQRYWNDDRTGYVDYEIKDDHIWLDIIKVIDIKKRHQQIGTKLLDVIKKMASIRGIPIILDPLTSNVSEFFKTNGFGSHTENLMIWKS